MKHYLTPDPATPTIRDEPQRAELARVLHPTALQLRRVVQTTLQELRDTASRLLATPHSAIRTPRPRRRRNPKK
jgi:hypothetical protein